MTNTPPNLSEIQQMSDAILSNNPKAINDLINKNTELLNLKNHELKTPLDLALYNGNLSIAKVLLSKNVDVNSINREGLTPLHTLIKRIDFYLLQNINVQNILEMPKLLISLGARVNFQDRRGNTVINYIAQKAKANQLATDVYTKIGKIIIAYDKKSDVTVQIKNNMGKTPLDYLSRNGNMVLYDAVYEALPHNRNYLENAIKEGEQAVFRVLEISKEQEIA